MDTNGNPTATEVSVQPLTDLAARLAQASLALGGSAVYELSVFGAGDELAGTVCASEVVVADRRYLVARTGERAVRVPLDYVGDTIHVRAGDGG